MKSQLSPNQAYQQIWDKSRTHPLCGVCRFPMTFPFDAERGQHVSCVAVSWPTGSNRRRFVRNPFRLPKEQS